MVERSFDFGILIEFLIWNGCEFEFLFVRMLFIGLLSGLEIINVKYMVSSV